MKLASRMSYLKTEAQHGRVKYLGGKKMFEKVRCITKEWSL